MASVSFSVARNGDVMNNLATGADTVTEGSSAPGAGSLEVRIDLDAGWTLKEIENQLDAIWRFAADKTKSTTIPL